MTKSLILLAQLRDYALLSSCKNLMGRYVIFYIIASLARFVKGLLKKLGCTVL